MPPVIFQLMQDYEKLGVFYLGREHDLSTRTTGSTKLLYDSKDLVTHGVCVGMTGSGKTGLCIGLLEEAAIDSIPSIIIDPKGDLSNLLLTFPNLKPEDFRDWINEDDARKQELDPDAFAAKQAELWKNGLAKWDQDAARIQRLKNAADVTIYTPGSTAGVPVSILASFAHPGHAILDDAEIFQQRIATTVTSLLGLLDIDADPLTSREHIFLSNVISASWSAGQDVTLHGLVQQIQNPPPELATLGALDLESFFPAKERFKLAMRINTLLAAPSFKIWTQGVPLDISALLHTPTGKPRIAIFSIAHLSDSERMFFVSLLLNQILGWVRTQSGTTSLRAILYMDEIFGYFPPVANPPSKQPLLTLLKQARAFGLGIVLATQNPTDLDYKGLANCGTWFIGRLQTERDKLRVLGGLEGAAAGASQKFDRQKMEQLLAGLGNRVFLMNNVHDDAPTVFESRWALSYLRGPLGREEIKRLMDPVRGHVLQTAAPIKSQAVPATTVDVVSAQRPILPPTVRQTFVPVRSRAPASATLLYEPYLLASADVYYANAKAAVDVTRQTALLAAFGSGAAMIDWAAAAAWLVPESELSDQPEENAAFDAVPPGASDAKQIDKWTKSFIDHLYRTARLELFSAPAAKLTSTPDECERDFRARLSQAAREERDALAEKLRLKYAPKHASLEERLRKAQQAKAKEEQEASSSTLSAAMSVGASLLGAFL
ncbi:MAG TPA: hypothetical protein VGB55_15140, partial [Tepidisphaeraceae bacterium]